MNLVAIAGAIHKKMMMEFGNTRTMMKICTKCHQEKPLERFSFKDAKKNTKRSQCKDCVNKKISVYKKGVPYADGSYVAPKKTEVVPPARLNLWERPVYQPPKWNIVR